MKFDPSRTVANGGRYKPDLDYFNPDLGRLRSGLYRMKLGPCRWTLKRGRLKSGLHRCQPDRDPTRAELGRSRTLRDRIVSDLIQSAIDLLVSRFSDGSTKVEFQSTKVRNVSTTAGYRTTT
jgi:hypothetical protein